MTALEAVKTMRKYVGVYLAALAKGPLTPHQAESLAIDLKTFDKDLAVLEAEEAAKVAAPAVVTPAASQAVAPPNFGASNRLSSALYGPFAKEWNAAAFGGATVDFEERATKA